MDGTNKMIISVGLKVCMREIVHLANGKDHGHMYKHGVGKAPNRS